MEDKEIIKKNYLKRIKNTFILKKIMSNIDEYKLLKIIRNNKTLINRLNKDINDYIKFTIIKIEITPKKDESGKYINILEKDKSFYHIYFNNNKNETSDLFIKKDDSIEKIKIIIDSGINNIKELFKDCRCIEKINFIIFNKLNVTDMSHLFDGCISLKEINISKFKTNKVSDMSYMFNNCISLKDINISNFNTNNVINIAKMFSDCSSLEKIDLSKFNTNNIINMSGLFEGCFSLIIRKIKFVKF